MKKIIFILVILCFGSFVKVKAQENLPGVKKGIELEFSFDPKYLEDIRLSLGYKFKDIKLSANYEFYGQIGFNAYDIQFTYYFIQWKVMLGTGFHVGIVNEMLGLGVFLEERVWLNKNFGLFLQQKILSNGSNGQYYENRIGIYSNFQL